MFQNSNVVVTGGHFMNVMINNTGGHDAVSTTLWQHVASGAIFDSAERHALGKCHPGTREKMIERIMCWVDDPNPTQHILWLNGFVGSGKSALAHTICELLRQTHPDRYGGSFFFARDHAEHGKGLKLFVTLSYQLAVQFPSIRAEINAALYRDPSLPTKSMEIQLSSLIVQPLVRCRAFLSHSPTLIIDGLDECADDQGINTPCTIISLISQSVVGSNIPLRFMIASRPESWICDTFETLPLPSIALTLSLPDDIDADRDIKKYLTEEFEKIRLENKRVMGETEVVLPWPPTNIIDRLVYEASRQYLYASTVLKFVGKSSRFSDPQEQLRILTFRGPSRASAFSKLDRLYETIISAYPRPETMKRVLGGICARTNSTVIEHILDVQSTELSLVLDALSSLVDVKRPEPLSDHESHLEPIFGQLLPTYKWANFYHLSFQEFLEDRTRSGAFFVDTNDICHGIVRAAIGIIHSNIEHGYRTKPPLSQKLGHVRYCTMMDSVVLKDWKASEFDTLTPLIIGITQSLRLLELDGHVDYLGWLMRDLQWINAIFCPELSVRIDTPGFEPNKAEDFFDSLLQLQEITYSIWTKCINHLSLCKQFRITPTLAYLQESIDLTPPSITELFTSIPGQTITDILTTLEQHRPIIDVYFHHDNWRIKITDLSDDGVPQPTLGHRWDAAYEDKGWRTRGQWRHQRIFLAYQNLKTISNSGYKKGNPYIRLGNFFMSPNLSDIQTDKYFQNPCNLSILASLTDFSAWNKLSPLPRDFWRDAVNLITPVLCWFNRQLTNPTTVRLLDDHDERIVPQMSTTMKRIFEYNFLPQFSSTDYFCDLYIAPETFLLLLDIPKSDRLIKIKVSPLTQDTCQEEEVSQPIHYQSMYFHCWRHFHDEVFGKLKRAREQDHIPLTIVDHIHIRWHSLLASRLLNALTKYLYGLINDKFKQDLFFEEYDKHEKDFAYIVEFLPYAETTQQNLDSLRAIVYLFPRARMEWNLPVKFWSLSMEFLKRYDRSILSYEELDLFEKRMESMQHDTKRYPATAYNICNWVQ